MCVASNSDKVTRAIIDPPSGAGDNTLTVLSGRVRHAAL